jgi:hypothetical protein
VHGRARDNRGLRFFKERAGDGAEHRALIVTEALREKRRARATDLLETVVADWKWGSLFLKMGILCFFGAAQLDGQMRVFCFTLDFRDKVKR